MREQCPLCDHLLVMPYGPEKSPILIFGEFPGYKEIEQGVPWVGPAGDVLHAELVRAGLPPRECRMSNIWLHEPNDNPAEFDWHFKQLLKELKGRKAVFLLGSDVAKVFLEASVTDYVGLKVKSKYLPPSVEMAMVCWNPAIVTNRGSSLGEVRLAFEKFANASRRYLK